jgi:Trk-type K+ transport system membrane component
LIALAIVIVLSIKFREFGAKTKLTALILVLVLFFGTLGYVWFVARPDLTTYQGFLSLGRAYYSWCASLFGNMGSITGYAVHQDWGASNLTAAP